MSRKGNWETNIKVPFAGREYNVLQGTWPSGSRALLLVNPDTGKALPGTLETGQIPRHPYEVFVPDTDGMVKALEDAGVIKATSVVSRWHDLNVRSCELVHPELVKAKTPKALIGYVYRDGEGEPFSNPRQEPEMER